MQRSPDLMQNVKVRCYGCNTAVSRSEVRAIVLYVCLSCEASGEECNLAPAMYSELLQKGKVSPLHAKKDGEERNTNSLQSREVCGHPLFAYLPCPHLLGVPSVDHAEDSCEHLASDEAPAKVASSQELASEPGRSQTLRARAGRGRPSELQTSSPHDTHPPKLQSPLSTPLQNSPAGYMARLPGAGQPKTPSPLRGSPTDLLAGSPLPRQPISHRVGRCPLPVGIPPLPVYACPPQPPESETVAALSEQRPPLALPVGDVVQRAESELVSMLAVQAPVRTVPAAMPLPRPETPHSETARSAQRAMQRHRSAPGTLRTTCNARSATPSPRGGSPGVFTPLKRARPPSGPRSVPVHCSKKTGGSPVSTASPGLLASPAGATPRVSGPPASAALLPSTTQSRDSSPTVLGERLHDTSVHVGDLALKRHVLEEVMLMKA